ncbi:hypothetical protein [Leifsonia sp. TF02-11]|uniref:hypothetical protein n=1 Tax=Leifsonia sp. TF02-11 TaxID=2815212 RepID=UPI001AA14749|nr:hypothetical protein [Leifsonia sp. TF02-11]MBO1737188.1 hypothetical protein [Leifsonia sp. TF02-11]
MTGERADAASDDGDALVARLDVIEAQPLAERADAYAQLHEVLQARLEGSDRLRDD